MAFLRTTGEMQLPQNTKNIAIKENGSIAADGKEIGKIRIVNVSKLSTLESVGRLFAYKLSDNAQPPEDTTDFEIANHYLEKSNVMQ